MKVRLDFVTNSSSSSFVYYIINHSKHPDKDIFDEQYKSQWSARQAISSLNLRYNIKLSDEDILRCEDNYNHGEANHFLPLYGILNESVVETYISSGGLHVKDEVSFLMEDIRISPDALTPLKANKFIQAFIQRFGDGQKIVVAYEEAFKKDGKTSEEVVAILQDYLQFFPARNS